MPNSLPRRFPTKFGNPAYWAAAKNAYAELGNARKFSKLLINNTRLSLSKAPEMSSEFNYLYELPPNFEIAQSQEIIQLFYFALASYELNIEVNLKKCKFTKLVGPPSSIPSMLNPFPEPVAKEFQASYRWKDFFIIGDISIQTQGEFYHELFIPFFILESKLIDYKMNSTSADSPQMYSAFVKTMVEDPDLTSFSVPVLYSLDNYELELLFSLFHKLLFLLSEQRWSYNYKEVMEELMKLPTWYFVYPSCFSAEHLLKFPRARKAWLMYRLCIPSKKVKSVDSWIYHFRETYKWMMEQVEKIYMVLHPSRKFNDSPTFTCETAHLRAYKQRENELYIILVYYMMKEFHLPSDFVQAYCDATTRQLLTEGLLRPKKTPQDLTSVSPYVERLCIPKLFRTLFAIFVGREPIFDKSGRIKMVEEFRLISEHLNFISNVSSFYWLFDYPPVLRGRYWINGPRSDEYCQNLILNAKKAIAIHNKYLHSPIHTGKFTIDEKFLNHLLIHSFHCLVPAYDHILDLQVNFPSVSDWQKARNTINDYFVLVADHIEMVQHFSEIYRYDGIP